MRNWYRITQAAASGAGSVDELNVYDEIGFWGVEGKTFAEQIKNLAGDSIRLLINSPGGSVFDAVLMFNALKMTGKSIEVKVMGIAASAASYLAMVGDKITMPDNTMMMLHKPSMIAWGNADAMRETADILDKVGEGVENTYKKRSGMSDEKMAEIMSKDSFLTAKDCKELGLCDEVTDAIEAKAHFDPKGLPDEVLKLFEMRHPTEPKNEADPVEDPVQDPAAEPAAVSFEETRADMIRRVVEQSGIGAEFVDAFALDETITNQAEAVTAVSMAREVKALCDIAKKPQLAADHIRLRTPVDKVRAELRGVARQADEATHTSNLKALKTPEAGTKPQAQIDPEKIYAKRNKARVA